MSKLTARAVFETLEQKRAREGREYFERQRTSYLAWYGAKEDVFATMFPGRPRLSEFTEQDWEDFIDVADWFSDQEKRDQKYIDEIRTTSDQVHERIHANVYEGTDTPKWNELRRHTLEHCTAVLSKISKMKGWKNVGLEWLKVKRPGLEEHMVYIEESTDQMFYRLRKDFAVCVIKPLPEEQPIYAQLYQEAQPWPAK